MKTLRTCWGSIGTGLFWLLWPAFFVYFRLSGNRSRVLVVHQEEILLLQTWLGNKKWGFPGGGSKKNETAAAAAVRELSEEVGIYVPETSLKKLGTYKHKKHHLNYTSELFVLSLSEKPELRLQKKEIWNARWVELNEVKSYVLNSDARSALRRYRPPEQASLL